MKALGTEKLNQMQERIGFVLASGLDVFIAGPPNSGKRISYLITMLTNLLNELHQHEQKPEVKSTELLKSQTRIYMNLTMSYFLNENQVRKSAPFSLIICENTQKGMYLNSFLEFAFERLSKSVAAAKPKVVFLDNIQNNTTIASLAEPLDILILTFASLQQLFCNFYDIKFSSLGLNYHRIRYLVFEELAMKNYFVDDEILQLLYCIKRPPNFQIIFSGTSWYNQHTGLVRQNLFRKLDRKSVMIFGSVQHALQFSSSISWKISHIISEKAKLNCVIGICKGMLIEKRKIVVACTTSETAFTVSKYISDQGGICNKVVTLGVNEGISSSFFVKLK